MGAGTCDMTSIGQLFLCPLLSLPTLLALRHYLGLSHKHPGALLALPVAFTAHQYSGNYVAQLISHAIHQFRGRAAG